MPLRAWRNRLSPPNTMALAVARPRLPAARERNGMFAAGRVVVLAVAALLTPSLGADLA